MPIPERFSQMLNLQQYQKTNEPLRVCKVSAQPNTDRQMILRMLIESPYSKGMKLPSELLWASEIIKQAKQFQRKITQISHPFTYVTVRHGVTTSLTDDEWHVDGFSMRYNHLPEANYILSTGEHPTEFIRQAFVFPDDFDPLRHNINKYFQRRIDEDSISRCKPNVLYFVDPYVVHRRPPITQGSRRTLVRISFTPIEIPDVNNTRNPLIKTEHYVMDGVKDFRNTLSDYDQKAS